MGLPEVRLKVKGAWSSCNVVCRGTVSKDKGVPSAQANDRLKTSHSRSRDATKLSIPSTDKAVEMAEEVDS